MSLHRRLAETAEREGVRLKQYIVYLLSDAAVGLRMAGCAIALFESSL
jgi:hypothetical protein